MTSAQLATLVEGEDLDIEPQGPQEKVPEYRARVRDALKAKLAEQGNSMQMNCRVSSSCPLSGCTSPARSKSCLVRPSQRRPSRSAGESALLT